MNLKHYNPKWKNLFEKEKELLKHVFGNEAFDIQHIGSTAVPNIQSKPIIDIAVLTNSYKKIDSFFDKLKNLGYKYSEKRSSSERYFFTKGDPTEYHLSIANPNTSYLKRQIIFRDYLIEHPKTAKEYEVLKNALIKKYPSGKDEYSYGKNKFIDKILKIAETNN